MGVAGLFAFLRRRYPQIVEQCGQQALEAGAVDEALACDNLYIDLNHIIHACTHPAWREAPHESEQEMFQEMEIYLDRLVCMTRPTQLLLVAMDGVAPLAKMAQQRGRRFFSAHQEQLRAELEAQILLGLLTHEPHFSILRESEALNLDAIEGSADDSDLFWSPVGEQPLHLLRLSTLRQYLRCDFSDLCTPPLDEEAAAQAAAAAQRQQQQAAAARAEARAQARAGREAAEAAELAAAQQEWEGRGAWREEGVDLITGERRQVHPRARRKQLQRERAALQARLGLAAGAGEAEEEHEEVEEDEEEDAVLAGPQGAFGSFGGDAGAGGGYGGGNSSGSSREQGGGRDFERVLDDIVLLTFLAGNDFLPSLPSLDFYDRPPALEVLLDIYKDLLRSTTGSKRGYLTSQGRVDPDKLAWLFARLGEREGAAFAERERRKVREQRRQAERDRQAAADASSAQGGGRGGAHWMDGSSEWVSMGELPPGQDVDDYLLSNTYTGFGPGPGVGGEEDTFGFGGSGKGPAGAGGAPGPGPGPSSALAGAGPAELRRELLRRLRQRMDDRMEAGKAADPIRFSVPGARGRYYSRCFDPEAAGGEALEGVARRACEEFCRGLVWTMQYYTCGNPAVPLAPAASTADDDSTSRQLAWQAQGAGEGDDEDLDAPASSAAGSVRRRGRAAKRRAATRRGSQQAGSTAAGKGSQATPYAGWDWLYPFHYAPMAADLAKYGRDALRRVAASAGSKASASSSGGSGPVQPFAQLMSVLPPSSIPACLPPLLAAAALDPDIGLVALHRRLGRGGGAGSSNSSSSSEVEEEGGEGGKAGRQRGSRPQVVLQQRDDPFPQDLSPLVDLSGRRWTHTAVVRLPFPDVPAISAFVSRQLQSEDCHLSAEERSRNAFRPALLFMHREHPLAPLLLAWTAASKDKAAVDEGRDKAAALSVHTSPVAAPQARAAAADSAGAAEAPGAEAPPAQAEAGRRAQAEGSSQASPGGAGEEGRGSSSVSTPVSQVRSSASFAAALSSSPGSSSSTTTPSASPGSGALDSSGSTSAETGSMPFGAATILTLLAPAAGAPGASQPAGVAAEGGAIGAAEGSEGQQEGDVLVVPVDIAGQDTGPFAPCLLHGAREPEPAVTQQQWDKKQLEAQRKKAQAIIARLPGRGAGKGRGFGRGNNGGGRGRGLPGVYERGREHAAVSFNGGRGGAFVRGGGSASGRGRGRGAGFDMGAGRLPRGGRGGRSAYMQTAHLQSSYSNGSSSTGFAAAATDFANSIDGAAEQQQYHHRYQSEQSGYYSRFGLVGSEEVEDAVGLHTAAGYGAEQYADTGVGAGRFSETSYRAVQHPEPWQQQYQGYGQQYQGQKDYAELFGCEELQQPAAALASFGGSTGAYGVGASAPVPSKYQSQYLVLVQEEEAAQLAADEEFARQLQAQFDSEARGASSTAPLATPPPAAAAAPPGLPAQPTRAQPRKSAPAKEYYAYSQQAADEPAEWEVDYGWGTVAQPTLHPGQQAGAIAGPVPALAVPGQLSSEPGQQLSDGAARAGSPASSLNAAATAFQPGGVPGAPLPGMPAAAHQQQQQQPQQQEQVDAEEIMPWLAAAHAAPLRPCVPAGSGGCGERVAGVNGGAEAVVEDDEEQAYLSNLLADLGMG